MYRTALQKPTWHTGQGQTLQASPPASGAFRCHRNRCKTHPFITEGTTSYTFFSTKEQRYIDITSPAVHTYMCAKSCLKECFYKPFKRTLHDQTDFKENNGSESSAIYTVYSCSSAVSNRCQIFKTYLQSSAIFVFGSKLDLMGGKSALNCSLNYNYNMAKLLWYIYSWKKELGI